MNVKRFGIAVIASSGVMGCASTYSNFYAKYAGTCQFEDVAFDPQVVVTGPEVSAFKIRFADALDDEGSTLRRCYSDALRYGELHGKIALQLVVEPDGKLRRIAVSQDPTAFTPFACCLVSVVRGLKLPPTHAPAALGFEYPFVFRTLRMPGTVQMAQQQWGFGGASPDGYRMELDESSVVVGGGTLYPVGSDSMHHYLDTPEAQAEADKARRDARAAKAALASKHTAPAPRAAASVTPPPTAAGPASPAAQSPIAAPEPAVPAAAITLPVSPAPSGEAAGPNAAKP